MRNGIHITVSGKPGAVHYSAPNLDPGLSENGLIEGSA